MFLYHQLRARSTEINNLAFGPRADLILVDLIQAFASDVKKYGVIVDEVELMPASDATSSHCPTNGVDQLGR